MTQEQRVIQIMQGTIASMVGQIAMLQAQLSEAQERAVQSKPARHDDAATISDREGRN